MISRSVVLPTLKAADVAHKPEVGDSYRAQLVRLLTSNSGDVGTLVEEFIFILCKENVSRMIKYTGIYFLFGGLLQAMLRLYGELLPSSATEPLFRLRLFVGFAVVLLLLFVYFILFR